MKLCFVELLGVPKDIVDDFDVIRRQWCAEPSVPRWEKAQSPTKGKPRVAREHAPTEYLPL